MIGRGGSKIGDMRDILHKIRSAKTIEEIFTLWSGAAEAEGVMRGCYHFTPAFKSQLGEDVSIAMHGYPAEWVELYADPEFRLHDPVPDFVIKKGRIMSWADAIADQNLSPEQEAFMGQFHALGHCHGFSVPLYGANSRQSYCSYGLDEPVDDLGTPEVTYLSALAEFAHIRLCTIVQDQLVRDRKLSAREMEVIHWLSRGKSNTDIATILGATPSTIDTHIRRIYQKMDVNNRIAAVVEALKAGLITF